MKTCSKCNIEKDLSEFYTNQPTNRCKLCIGIYAAKYHKDHREQRNEYNRRYFRNTKRIKSPHKIYQKFNNSILTIGEKKISIDKFISDENYKLLILNGYYFIFKK